MGEASSIRGPAVRATTNASSRTGLNTSRTWIALGLTGQFSWQTMHGRSIAQGRHRPRSTKAVPIRSGPLATNGPRPSFSSRPIGRMAAVGQTCEQATQLS